MVLERHGQGFHAKYVLKGVPERYIHIIHGDGQAKVFKARDTVLGDTAGHDAVKVAEVWCHIDGNAVVGDPLAYPHADGGHLVLPACAALDPKADTALAPLRLHSKRRHGAGDDFLKAIDKLAHVTPAFLEVEEEVDHALAGAVVGILPAAPGVIDREPVRVHEVSRVCTGTRGIKRWVFKEPHKLGRFARANGTNAVFHFFNRIGVGHKAVADSPFKGRGAHDIHLRKTDFLPAYIIPHGRGAKPFALLLP